MVKETLNHLMYLVGDVQTFQSPLGEVVKETTAGITKVQVTIPFQSPLGEVVKETNSSPNQFGVQGVCFNPLSGKW